MINKFKTGDEVWVKWHKQNELWIKGFVVGFTPKRIKVDLTWTLDNSGKEIHIQNFIAHNVTLAKDWFYNHDIKEWQKKEDK